MAQVLLQKEFERVDFLTTTVYEKTVIPKSPRFIIRQGDLIVTNYPLSNPKSMGIRYAHPKPLKENTFLFRHTHLFLAEGQKTILVHKEHGVVEIPQNYYDLNLYTFERAVD